MQVIVTFPDELLIALKEKQINLSGFAFFAALKPEIQAGLYEMAMTDRAGEKVLFNQLTQEIQVLLLMPGSPTQYDITQFTFRVNQVSRWKPAWSRWTSTEDTSSS